jgi:sulfite oxidase
MAQQIHLAPLTRRELLARAALFGLGGAALGANCFAAEPAPGKLIVRSEKPYNAEPSLADLAAAWITPEPLFYVRNHGNAPAVDLKAFRLEVSGLVERPLSLSLAELQALGKPVTIPATLTCAGNRRNEFAKIKAVGGVQWEAGAVGNARWTGLRLAALLAKAGVKEGAKHVWFEGLDDCVHENETTRFGASIPLDRAHDYVPAPALLAWQMNGEPLTANHGFPLRTVVPGYIGARSVKWLSKVVVSDRPSPNYFQAVAYKLIQKPEDAAAAEPIYHFPLNSAICVPAPGAKRQAGQKLPVTGYVLGPEPQVTGLRGERFLVEVSSDGGNVWTKMKLLDESQPCCWQRFEGEIKAAANAKSLLVRAVDPGGQPQPREMKWNAKGYLYNAWHEVPLG